jgi:chemotaxis protein MotA
MANKAAAHRKLRPDLATLGGLVVAVAAIVGGLILEGGSLHDISQVTALLIVLGGTLGAVMVHYPLVALRGGILRLRERSV